jgi:hypothetical protein
MKKMCLPKWSMQQSVGLSCFSNTIIVYTLLCTQIKAMVSNLKKIILAVFHHFKRHFFLWTFCSSIAVYISVVAHNYYNNCMLGFSTLHFIFCYRLLCLVASRGMCGLYV